MCPVWFPTFPPISSTGIYPVSVTFRCCECSDMADVPQELLTMFICVEHGWCKFYMAYETIEYSKRLV